MLSFPMKAQREVLKAKVKPPCHPTHWSQNETALPSWHLLGTPAAPGAPGEVFWGEALTPAPSPR